MASDANTITHLATLVKDHRLSSLCVATESGKLRWKVNDVNLKAFKAVSSAKQLQAKVSAKAEERDSSAGKCEELVLEVHCIPGWAKETKSLRAQATQMEEASKTKVSKVQIMRRTTGMDVVV